MESGFLINVSINGKHFFRTDKIVHDEKAKEVYRELRKRFPEAKITCTYWDCRGFEVIF